MKILYLIAARGGSKSIPRKNLETIEGLSLVGFKARAARQARSCARLILSSDSPEIQAEARAHGAETPFTRPAHLATDAATTADVVRHAMDWIEEERAGVYDAVMLLEPSSPFASGRDFDQAAELMKRTDATAVIGVREMEVNSIFTGPMEPNGSIRPIVEKFATRTRTARQQLEPEYTMNGALYLFRWDRFRATGAIYSDPDRTYGYLMDRRYSVEIDEPVDLEWARFLAREGHVDLDPWLNHRAAVAIG